MSIYVSVDNFGYFDVDGAGFGLGDAVSIATQGWWELSDISGVSPRPNYVSGTYLGYQDIPNQFITKCINNNYYGSVGNYNNERELFDVLVTEAYNKHGVCMDFYVTSYDKDYDRIWGEDNDRSFTRRFKVMSFYRLPREEKM